MTRIAIVDTETTGLSHADEPISIGLIVIKVDDKGGLIHEIGRYYGLQEPTVPIHPAASRVHGLSIDELRGKRFNHDAVSTLISQADVCIAHNATFDARMLNKIVSTPVQWRCSYRQDPWNMEAGKKLDDVCVRFGVERGNPHNSLSDCEALLACLMKRTGKTDRSRTYLKTLIDSNPYRITLEPSSATPRRSSYRNASHIEVRASMTDAKHSVSLSFMVGRLIGKLFRDH